MPIVDLQFVDWRLFDTVSRIKAELRLESLVAVFHGNANLKKLNFIEKQILNNIEPPLGDLRDWETFTSWAMAFAGDLRQTAS